MEDDKVAEARNAAVYDWQEVACSNITRMEKAYKLLQLLESGHLFDGSGFFIKHDFATGIGDYPHLDTERFTHYVLTRLEDSEDIDEE